MRARPSRAIRVTLPVASVLASAALLAGTGRAQDDGATSTAPAPTSPTSPTSTSIVASDPPVPPSAVDPAAGWFVVPSDVACDTPPPHAPATEITLRSAICVEIGIGRSVEAGERLVEVDALATDGDSTSTTTTPPGASAGPTDAPGQRGDDTASSRYRRLEPRVDWGADTLPRADASFTIRVGDDEAVVELTVVPELRLEVLLVPRVGSAVATIDPTATPTTTPATPTPTSELSPTTSVDPAAPLGESASAGALSDAPAVLSRRSSLTKQIRVTGPDAAIDGLYVDEEMRPGQLRVVVGGEEVHTAESEPESESVRLDLDGTSVSYELGLASEANFGPASVTQRTTLKFGDVTLDEVVNEYALDAPRLKVDVQALAEVIGGEDTLVTVLVTNLRDRPMEGPLFVTLGPSQGGDLIRDFGALNGGTESDNVVTWEIPAGLGAGGETVRTLQVGLNPAGEGSRVEWQGAVRVRPDAGPLAGETLPMTIRSGSGATAEGVDFTPAQLIRLIAFVMAFAILAVIFGAWRRTPHDDDALQRYELERFQTYAETILVLVVLVAVLVLALRESLSGESAASLIGVIAGYAFGRGRNQPERDRS